MAAFIHRLAVNEVVDAATARTAGDADALDGIDSTGFVRKDELRYFSFLAETMQPVDSTIGTVEVDSEGDPLTALEIIRAVLSADIQLVSRSRVNREESDQELMAAMCEHIEAGGNNLIEIIEMARTADGDNRFSRAFVAASSLPTVCPTWAVVPEASELLRNLHEMLIVPQSRSDATTADLVSFWEDTCAAADEGKLLDEHPTGPAIDWDNPSTTADAALFGFMFMCPDARNTIVELIDAG